MDKEANAAETLFRYLRRQEQLGDSTIKYVDTPQPIIYEHERDSSEGAANQSK